VNEVEAAVTVPVAPAEAFELFTRDVDRWWRRGERYGGSSVVGHRFEPWIGGRFVQVLHDRDTELGRIVVWEPPSRVAFSWRQGNWRPDEVTRIEVTFTPVSGGTQVLLRHFGFDGIESQVGCEIGYSAGWAELLGWFAEAASEGAAWVTAR
jgi:uncharacterized protein YndB with AHSA1/START domain